MRVYHFVGETLRDGWPVPPDGEWLEYDGPLVMCKSGLHGSEHPFDALQYAPGPILCLCDLEGAEAQGHTDKVVGRRRKIIKRIDTTKLLREFACGMALSVIHLWDAPEIVRLYLETGDESLRAAAWAAANAAAWDAANAAAWAAANAAASAAASDAARAAASAAASDAARAAAWAAANAAASAAARAAAWAAANAAAWDAARVRFKELVDGAFGKVRP